MALLAGLLGRLLGDATTLENRLLNTVDFVNEVLHVLEDVLLLALFVVGDTFVEHVDEFLLVEVGHDA